MMQLISLLLLIAQLCICEELSFSEKYDFIIVGGGAAGSVLANRLSEQDRWTVLLLEIGEEPPQETDIPMLVANFQFTQHNWNYTWEPQEAMGMGLRDGRIAIPRGRVLGGSTTLNYMMHTRGNSLDYDRWENLGNNGWGYQKVLSYFKKSEDYQVKLQDENLHSTGGYLAVEDVSYRTPSAHGFVQAMQESGFPIIDYNGKHQMGVSYVHANTKNGRRNSGVRAFLDPIRNRQNLKITTGAQVTRVLFATNTLRATGVEALINGEIHNIKAKKEVILSGGALNSPQILMLSGIGPKKHLEDLNIKVNKDLPVGQRLFDHIGYVGLTFLVNDTNYALDKEALEDHASLDAWITNGTGPLTVIGGPEALAFVKTNFSTYTDPNYPDIEFVYVGMPMHVDKGKILRRTMRISDDMYNSYWKDYEDKPGFMVLVLLLRPFSYGNVTLTSKNPFDYPKFYGNFYTDENNEDLKTVIAGIRNIIDIISKSPTMQKVNATLIDRPVPGCEDYESSSDSYWECAIRHLSISLHHPQGTCKMAPASDPEAVVDDRLRVHGIESLRVVDASVIPEPVTGHTTAPTYMIAEKASDMIKEDQERFCDKTEF